VDRGFGAQRSPVWLGPSYVLKEVEMLMQSSRRGGFAAALCSVVLLSTTVSFGGAQSGFTELIPSGPEMPPVAPGMSPWGGGVQLAASFLSWLNNQVLRSNIQARLDSMRAQIAQVMPATGGVLVVIGIQQSEQPDINGEFVRSVLDGYVAGTGPTPKATMEAYLAEDRLEQGVPPGFQRRNVYFWEPADRSQR